MLGIYNGKILKKFPMAWSNIYGAGLLGMGHTIFQGTGEISRIHRVLIRGCGLDSS